MVRLYTLKNSILFRDASFENYVFYVFKKDLTFFNLNPLKPEIQIGVYFVHYPELSSEIMSFELGDVLKLFKFSSLPNTSDVEESVVQIQGIQYGIKGRTAVLTIAHV